MINSSLDIGTAFNHTITNHVNGYLRNVRDSDATLIILLKAELTGGSKFTYEYARRIAKPCLHVHPDSKWHEQIKAFVDSKLIQILNVAGPRNSIAPNIAQFVNQALDKALD
ncbi:MAG: hypothetical protein H0X02_09045 [Nitrosomonas sp.]|nr:hypothetical protein [Nitrosomonas sp.]